MNDLVSIVVPIYNVEKYLDRCIDSLISQTYKNIEIILVDDGSTDKSGKMCDVWKEKSEKIIVIHKKNGGLSDARNYGIDVANGKYICFVDSDDFVDVNMIESMMKTIEKYKTDIVICNRYYYEDSGKKRLRFKYKDDDLIMNSKEAICEMNLMRNFDMSAWAKLYKIELFKDIRFPLRKLSEDYFIMYKLFDSANKIVYTAKPYYYYYQRVGSISKSAKLNYDFIEAAYEQMKYVEDKYPELKECVRATYGASNMTVYNALLKVRATIPKNETKKLKAGVKENINYILKYDKYSITRKIQAFLFITSIPLYNLSFKIMKFIKKV